MYIYIFMQDKIKMNNILKNKVKTIFLLEKNKYVYLYWNFIYLESKKKKKYYRVKYNKVMKSFILFLLNFVFKESKTK